MSQGKRGRCSISLQGSSGERATGKRSKDTYKYSTSEECVTYHRLGRVGRVEYGQFSSLFVRPRPWQFEI